MKKFLTILVVLISIAGLTSCATIIRGSKSEVTFESQNGETLDLVITDMEGTEVFSGPTPATVTLKKQAGAFKPAVYTVKASVAGAADGVTIELTTGQGNFAWGALLLGDWLGLSTVTLSAAIWIDLFNGALYKWNAPQVVEGSGEVSGILEKKEGALMITAN